MLDTLLLQYIQICVSCPGHVNILHCFWKWFFLRHIEVNSRFNVMTTNDVFFNHSEVVAGFDVIFCFCCFRSFRASLKSFVKIFTPYGFILPQSWFSNFMISSKQFCVPSATGNMIVYPFGRYSFLSIDTSSVDFWRDLFQCFKRWKFRMRRLH